MKFRRASLDTCSTAIGVVVVIDVLRAFSTAAYAFSAGVREIILVAEVQEAIDKRMQMPGALLMGEVYGLPFPGFDFGNSPPQFDGRDLSGCRLIQRTSSGTQGVVRSQQAEILLAASFCNAAATAGTIQQRSPSEVTFVISGLRPGGWGDEDAACADYLEALLRGETILMEPLMERVRNSPPGRQFTDPALPDLPPADLEYCLAVDRFDFAMMVERIDGLNRMRPVTTARIYD